MNGLISGTGLNALLNVEEEPKQETGYALILLQLTVVRRVREMMRIHKAATKIPVPVRLKSILTVVIFKFYSYIFRIFL